MRPKHSIFCRDAGKSKLVFETEKKAWNFIRFNGQEILEESGKIPCRVYYCESCGGYHTSSKRNPGIIKSRTPDIIDAYKRETGKINNFILSKEQLEEISRIIFNLEKIVGSLLNNKNSKEEYEEKMKEVSKLFKKLNGYEGNKNRIKKITNSIKKVKSKYEKEKEED